jgi:NDP-sugar pyrophosphorylase family protein
VNALLLAAGLGQRFRPHTEIVAKPVLPFLNLPLFSYPLFHLKNMGLKNLILNTHHLPKTVSATLASFSDGAEYKTHVLHESEILGSGGGILNAKTLLSTEDHFFVINADEIFFFQNGESLRKLYDQHVQSGALATLMTTEHPEAGASMGGIETSGHKITGLSVRTRSENTKHFVGVFIFSKRIFDFMPQKTNFHIFTDVLDPAIARGEIVNAYNTKNILWLDVTDEKNYLNSTKQALRQLWAKSGYGKQLNEIFLNYRKNYTQTAPNVWMGSRSEIHCDVSDEALVLVGDGTIVERPVGINGFAVFGSNVTFDQGFIEESVVASGVHMHELFALRNQLLLAEEFADIENQKSPRP